MWQIRYGKASRHRWTSWRANSKCAPGLVSRRRISAESFSPRDQKRRYFYLHSRNNWTNRFPDQREAVPACGWCKRSVKTTATRTRPSLLPFNCFQWISGSKERGMISVKSRLIGLGRKDQICSGQKLESTSHNHPLTWKQPGVLIEMPKFMWRESLLIVLSFILLLFLFFFINIDTIQTCLPNISPRSKSNNGVKMKAVTVRAGKTIKRHARNLMDL